jgi:energy-coupling factor transport system ATP-binding protein
VNGVGIRIINYGAGFLLEEVKVQVNKQGEVIIQAKDLTFSYVGSHQPALREINLEICQGDFVGITGPTGVGKTTLSYCINGVIPHFLEGTYTGDVLVKGCPVFDTSTQELSKWVGSVFQDPEAQLVSANVEEELAFGPENQALPSEEIAKRIDFALKSVGIIHLRNTSINSLSGGQKQRVAIAAVLAMLPEIILLDEPTAELDPVGTDDVFEVLKKLNEELGISVVIIEHKLEHLARYCRRLLIMEDGQIRIDGAPADIFSQWRKVQTMGVKPPQVTEFIGKLQEESKLEHQIPVTLENATLFLDNFLSGR